MYTERREEDALRRRAPREGRATISSPGWCALVLALALASSFTATASAQPLDSQASADLDAWLRTEDPVLVILVLDGFRQEALDARAPSGQPLMPHLQAVAQDALIFENCVTSSPEPTLGLFHLLTGRRALHGLRFAGGATGLSAWKEAGFELRGLCFRSDLPDGNVLGRAFPWLAVEPRDTASAPHDRVAAMSRMLEETLANPTPTVLVWVVDLLLPPFQLPDSWLADHDPTPWVGGQRTGSIEELRRNRLLRAQRVAHMSPETLRRARGLKETGDFEWLSTSAHAYADSALGDLLATLDNPEHRSRVSFVVTATHGMSRASGESTDGPLDSDACRVPLLWRLPGERPAGERNEAPVVPGDLVATLTRSVTPDAPLPAGAVDWRELVPPERERWSFYWDLERRTNGGRSDSIRLTTARLSYREGRSGRAKLFDLGVDPGEFEDLGREQTELTRTLHQRVSESLISARPEIWILVKPPGQGARIQGTLLPMDATGGVEPVATEPEDAVWEQNGLRFQFGGDAAGDGLRIRLDSGNPDVTLSLAGQDAPTWPVYIGGTRAAPVSALTWRLEFLQAEFLRSLTREAPSDPTNWIAEQAPGIHLWIVAPDAELLAP